MTITIKPKNKKEQARIKAILKATEIDFVEDIQDDDFKELLIAQNILMQKENQ